MGPLWLVFNVGGREGRRQGGTPSEVPAGAQVLREQGKH